MIPHPYQADCQIKQSDHISMVTWAGAVQARRSAPFILVYMFRVDDAMKPCYTTGSFRLFTRARADLLDGVHALLPIAAHGSPPPARAAHRRP